MMSGIELVRRSPANEEEIRTLVEGIGDHARDAIGSSGFEPVAVLARNVDGDLIGGVTATINWSWLSVRLLWVAEPERGRGLGARLMAAIEDLGRERGCRHAQVDTLGFQAPRFYERLGYEPFAELTDFAPGHSRIYFRKVL